MSSLEQAVHRAVAATPGWAALPAAQRASALRGAAIAVGAAADELGRLVSAETGKRVGDARGSALVARDTINQYAELGPLHRGRSLHGDPLAVDAMVPVPYGTVAVITPWNDPLAVAAQGIAAALAVGNTVVCKPSERATVGTARLVEVMAAALPDGVLTVVEGAGEIGAALVARPEIAAVVFTGSTAVGRAIATECGRHLKKAVLELGGKDALIVDDGVDPAWAAREAATAAFANAGQICVSAERLVVHRAVADAFAAELARVAKELRVGDPFDPATDVGPLVDRRHLDFVHRHVTDAVGRGAEVLVGGEPLDAAGRLYPPTVLTGVTADSLVWREETFGPVAPIRVVESFDEALAVATDSEYGLAAVVLTPSLAHAQLAFRRLPVGTVKVNAAFGGAPGGAATPHGASGLGFGYGPELLDELTRTRVLHLAAPPS
jgi:succinate-semialdehyde dehydrogenase / glutarate-semialdehyde dehydrogenase